MRRSPEANAVQEETEEPEKPMWKDIVLLVIGAVLIAVGAKLLVDNGTLIAEALGVPSSVIGLTMVALGTSLPELVTSLVAAKKNELDTLKNRTGFNKLRDKIYDIILSVNEASVNM